MAAAAQRMNRDEVARLIEHAPVFSRCSKRELRDLAGITDVVDVPAGRVLVREGEPGREFSVVVSGGAVVRRRGRKVGQLGPGDWLGEIALLTGGPRTATVTATGPTRLLVIRGGMFRSLVERTPSIAYKVLERVAAMVPRQDC